MNTALSILAAAVSGFIGSMGFGGGAVLIIFLTVFLNTKQFKAQGINLLFFIPIALTATIINAVKKRVDYGVVLPVCIGGIFGALAGFFTARFLGVKVISFVFGAAIFVMGILEIVKGVKTILARKKGR